MGNVEFKIGEIVALLPHPYYKGLTDVVISGDHIPLSPLMIIGEVFKKSPIVKEVPQALKSETITEGVNLENVKTDETKREVVKILYKCFWYSNKKSNFDEAWLALENLKLIEPTFEEQDLSIGDLVYFKTMELELQKLKSSFNIDISNVSNNERTVISPLLEFVSPIMQIIDIKSISETEKKTNLKKERHEKLISKGLAKCKWFNPGNGKISEGLLPIECLKKIKLISDEFLRQLNNSIKSGKVYKCEISKTSTLFKPRKILYKNGSYYVSGLEYISNSVKEILVDKLDHALIVDNPILKTGPSFDDLSKPEISKQAMAELILLVEQAIQGKNYIKMVYRNRNEKVDSRVISKFVILLDENKAKTFVQGYCHLRMELRTFRIERIQNLSVLNLKYD